MRAPLWGADYETTWGLKARAIYRSGELASVFRVDPEAIVSHPEYPLAWPLVLAGASALFGRYDELLLTALWPVLVSLCAFLAFRATRAASVFRVTSAAAVALLPYFRVTIYPGYAEALLLVFLLAALGTSQALEEGASGGARFGFALFLALAAFTKQEGALIGVIVLGALVLARRFRAAATIVAPAVVVGLVPWRLYAATHATGPARDYSLALLNPGMLLPSARILLLEAILPNAGWLLGTAVLLALAPETRRRRRGLLLCLAAYVAALFASLAFSRLDPWTHVHWAWDRLAFVIAALLIPTLAECAAETFVRIADERPWEWSGGRSA
jgi:hypothetical protein